MTDAERKGFSLEAIRARRYDNRFRRNQAKWPTISADMRHLLGVVDGLLEPAESAWHLLTSSGAHWDNPLVERLKAAIAAAKGEQA